MKSMFPRQLSALLLGSAFVLALATTVSLKAADATPADKTAAQGATLPVTTSVDKDPSGKHGGAYVLTVTSTASEKLKLTATVAQSMQSHEKPKTHTHKHTLHPGKTWKLDDLAAQDTVTLSAEGFAPVTVTVK